MQLPSANTEGANQTLSPIRFSTEAFIDRMIEQPALLRAETESRGGARNSQLLRACRQLEIGKIAEIPNRRSLPIPIARPKPES